MGITTDRNDPGLQKIESSGMQESYLVLSDEERAKGFVRPIRSTYRHVGCRPTGETRELTEEEHERYDKFGYYRYEPYAPDSSLLGRFWTKKQLESGCGQETTMGQAIAETYARDPKFYGGTFCCFCGAHFPVAEFIWLDGTVVGS